MNEHILQLFLHDSKKTVIPPSNVDHSCYDVSSGVLHPYFCVKWNNI